MIDVAKITVKAGDGGDGRVGFRREKYVPKGGPDGGDGGDGGSVYLETDKDLNTLMKFQYQQGFEAEKGEFGGKAKKHGKDGENIIIKVPVGTLIKLQITNHKYPNKSQITNNKSQTIDLVEVGQRICVAKGGKGGRGNWHFRSPELTTPRIAEKGKKGEEKELILELKLLADVGLIGLPNAGKSTLLSVLTKARPKIAGYPFTTLKPNLGVLEWKKKDLVIADIPGLIEGASKGKGLGDQFLRHVERCELLVHVIDGGELLTGEEKVRLELILENYKVIRKELKQYSKKLIDKSELIVLNKIDLLSKGQIKQVIDILKKVRKEVIGVSAATTENLEKLKKYLVFKGL